MCVHFFDELTTVRYIMISFEHYFVHGWEMALHSL